MEKLTIDNILARLEQSSMFHLSLGSKELFHSNFLYWISIVDWSVFIKIMRDLAGLKEEEVFWWEKEDIKDCQGKTYHPNNNNVEVRREFHNFDLSIYIRVYQEEDMENPTRKQETWIPVFVLENKMKSLPREDQLQEYTIKAINEWKKKKCKKELVTLWKEQPISFVLLSLFIDKEFEATCLYQEKGQTLFKVNWEKRNYDDLCGCLNNKHLGEEGCLNQKMFVDYRQFINALHELAHQDWCICENDSFVGKIYPKALENHKEDKQVQLRIDDIRQKVHYAQLKRMLGDALKKNELQAYETPVKKDDPNGLYYGTSFAHNIGILEIAVKQGKDIIIVQLQGNSYAHGFVYAGKKDAASRLWKLKTKMEPLFEFEEEIKQNEIINQRLTDKFPEYFSERSDKKNILYPQGVNKQAKKKGRKLQCFKYFGQEFAYQNVLIPDGVTIGQVIQAMIDDTKKCLEICSKKC